MNTSTETILKKIRPVAEIFREVTGKAPSSGTVSRLALTGRLKAVKCLGVWMCDDKAVVDYMELETAASMPGQVVPKPVLSSRSDKAKAKAQADSIAYLEANGIK